MTTMYARAISIPGQGWNVEVVDDYAADYPEHIPVAWLRMVGLMDRADSLGPHLAEFEARALAKQINERRKRQPVALMEAK